MKFLIKRYESIEIVLNLKWVRMYKNLDTHTDDTDPYSISYQNDLIDGKLTVKCSHYFFFLSLLPFYPSCCFNEQSV